MIDVQFLYDALDIAVDASVTKIRDFTGITKDIAYKYIADLIYETSQILVPVETGMLKASGKVTKNSIGTYSVIYNTPYAKYVHEIIDNWHEFPTQSKFLEDAAYAVLATAGKALPFTFTFNIGPGDEIGIDIDSISDADFANNINKILNNWNIITKEGIQGMDKVDTNFILGAEVRRYDIL